jgi:prepilin-type N-terminal cleavage/methylation domain-containing protein
MHGFTLIELLVVIAMITILAAMGIAQYRNGVRRAQEADPITESAETWTTIPAEADPANPSAEPGVYNVKSGATGTSMEGSAYSEF